MESSAVKSAGTKVVSAVTTGLSLEKMKLAKTSNRDLRKANSANRPKHPQLGQPIDWNGIVADKNGKPAISFTPRNELRQTMLKLINSDVRRLTPRARELRMQLIGKFRSEFVRIYARYRRAALVAQNKDNYFEVHPAEHKLAEKAAICCLMKSVTPIQAINYWHKKINSFANSKMDTPPLSMLSNPSVIDEVAINLSSKNREYSGLDESGESGWKPPKRKTMWLGDVSVLHPRLRKDLMAAGFDLSKYNDNDLSAIQDYAMDIKSNQVGVTFLPESLRPIVKWALNNTLKNCDPKDFSYRD